MDEVIRSFEPDCFITATKRMDQPVVMLERLPESVVEKFLNKEMKVHVYNQGYDLLQGNHFSNKQHAQKKPPHWMKRGIASGFYNKSFHKQQSNYNKVTANGLYKNFSEQKNSKYYDNTNNFCSGREGNFVIDPKQLHNSERQNTDIKVSSELKIAEGFSYNHGRTNKIVSTEQLLKQGKKRHRSGETISRNDSTLMSEENCDDINESLIQSEEFDSYDWQIVSEASCSDVSRDSSPSRENLLDAEYSVHTQLENNEASNQKTKFHEAGCLTGGSPAKRTKWLDMYPQNQNLNQEHESDDDDRLTEPYRSECEEDIDNTQNVKSPKSLRSIRIKLTGSRKNGFANITNGCDKEKCIKSELKTGSNNDIHTDISDGNSKNLIDASIKSIMLSDKCAGGNTNSTLSKQSPQNGEESTNFSSECQKSKTRKNLMPSNNAYDSEVITAKLSQLDNNNRRESLGNQQMGYSSPGAEKSESRNIRAPLNAECKTENAQNGQKIGNKESKFSQHDYVGLIMQAMDKSGPYSVTAKPDDGAQRTNASDENKNVCFKSNGMNKVQNYKETSVIPGRKELPEIPCFKQKKARMSRVTSVSKSFLCKDLKGTAMNKVEFNYMSRPTDMSESISNAVLKDHIKSTGDSEKSYRKADPVSNIANSVNKKLNNQVIIEKQGTRSLIMKTPTPRRCWRCGKPFGNNSNITDRLCKQCNSFDYTAVTQRFTNIQPNGKSKDGDFSKPFKVSCNNWSKTSSSEKQKANCSEWNKNTENSTSFHKSTSFVHHTDEEEQLENDAENESCSPLKLIVSLGTTNKLVEKTGKDRETIDGGNLHSKKLKKKRMRSASDTSEGVYEANKCVSALTKQTSGGNIICKIMKKGKHKDLSKKKKKIKLDTEDGSSDISGYYSEDNITSRSESTKDSSDGNNEVTLHQPSRNQAENSLNDSSDTPRKSTLNKKGNCEVRNVNRGLFLLSFSEPDEEELYQLKSGLYESSKRVSAQAATEESPEQLKSTSSLSRKEALPHQQVDVNSPKIPHSYSAASDPPSRKQSCPTLLDLQELVNLSQPATTSSQEISIQSLSFVESRTESNKLKSSESHVCEDDDAESKLSTLKIESVYSLKDLPTEIKPEEKRTIDIKIPFLGKHNVYNELDAYTTATILDMDGTKERSLTVLMSLLNREYRELKFVHEASRKTLSMEMQNEKLRRIDNIRTLQLACALMKQCQKCNKELSPEMLNLKPGQVSHLLNECHSGTSNESTATEKNGVEEEACASVLLGADKPEKESQKLPADDICVKGGISAETKVSGKQPVMHTTNTRKTVKFLLDQQKQLESRTSSSPTSVAGNVPALKQKTDDDVICIGISQLPRSSVQGLHSLDQQIISPNSAHSPEINSKNNDSQSMTSVSPNTAPPNVSVIKSHGLASPPAVSNFVSTSNSIPLQVVPGLAANHPLQVAVNAVTSAAAYQKTAVGYVKHQNYSFPANSIQKESNDNSKKPYVVSQLNKLPNGTTWIPSGIQSQWSSQQNQVLTPAATNEVLAMRNQGWRNNSPIQSNTPPSVPNQQKPVQQMPINTNPMIPLISQYGGAVPGHVIHSGMPVQARNLPPVPPMYNQTARTWHQPPNPLGATLRPTQQTPVVCIACRKPIGMTCPTGMFCSDICKKSYCARFPNYR